MLKGRAEASLSERFGRPVTIGVARAQPGLLVHPDDHARATSACRRPTGRAPAISRGSPTLSVRIRALKLLTGSVDPQDIAATGVRLNLVRAADGRENWRTTRDESGRGADRGSTG